jgi:hypothetical protein
VLIKPLPLAFVAGNRIRQVSEVDDLELPSLGGFVRRCGLLGLSISSRVAGVVVSGKERAGYNGEDFSIARRLV